MAKSKTQFICQNCAAVYPRWQGQCSDCRQWNTLVEEVVAPVAKGSQRTINSFNQADLASKIISFSQVKLVSGQKRRFSTGSGELDRCLGGGLVGGMVILLGGEPGIGKSTLLTQVILQMMGKTALQALATETHSLAKVDKFANRKKTPVAEKLDQISLPVIAVDNKTTNFGQTSTQAVLPNSTQVFYVAGEESPSQIMLRINRLLDNEQFIFRQEISEKKPLSREEKDQLFDFIRQNLFFITSTDADEIAALIQEAKPSLVIVDSIQTISSTVLSGASGSVGQIRESAERIGDAVKMNNIPCFLVGHITKDGEIAGPKILEHMVDAVLVLEGERSGQLRILRSLKNRFGPTDEVGIFQHEDCGLVEIANPSALFLENNGSSMIGAATVCLMEGTRPLLAEVQALVVKSQLALPRRVGRGIDLARIQVLAAVLQRHVYLPLGMYDIFLNVAGGFSIKESAVDLGLAVAIASSLANKKIPQNIVFIGEIGLLGEIRKTPYFDRRVKEAKRLGFKKVFSAETHRNIKQLLTDLQMLSKRAEEKPSTAW